MAEFKLGRLRFVWQGAWTTGTDYVKDDIVRYGGSSFVCVAAHTAAADFYTNLDAGKWQLMTSGLQWQTDPWTGGTYYPEGSVVRYGGKVYISVNGALATSSFDDDFDAGNWQLFLDGVEWKTNPWTASGTLYKEGDLVRHGGRVYICINGHTSDTGFESDYNANNWQLFTDGFQWKTSTWTADTLYKVGDVTRYGGKTYICINEHTANNTQNGGFYTDLGTSQWQLYTDGVQYVGVWNPSTSYYKLGDIVRYGGKSYICNLAHTSSADFYTDLYSHWQLFNDGQQWRTGGWTTSTYYKVGDMVRYGGRTYIALVGHTSSSTPGIGFDEDRLNATPKWELFSDGIQWKGEWSTGTYYKLGDVANYGGKTYTAVVAHNADADFYVDVDAGNWELLADGQQWKENPWTTSFLYKEGDVVRYGGKVYICINGHTSDGNVRGGFYTDLTANNWQLFADGNEWKGDWTTDIYYKLGDIVRYNGYVYVCNEAHASSLSTGASGGLEADQGKWDSFAEGIKYRGEWDTTTRYISNDVVKFGGSLYICTLYHVSGTTFDESKWSIFVGGLQFEDTWSAVVEYQIGDIVTYGGYSYVAIDRNTANIPPNEPTHWELLTVGFKVQGTWASGSSYKVGDLVRYGGNNYVCIANTTPGQKPVNPDGSTANQWQLVVGGFRWLGNWQQGTDYLVGDTVRWIANTYVCIKDHNSDTVNSEPDLDENGVYWNTMTEGSSTNVMAIRGDLMTRSATTNRRLPRGLDGQVLQVKGKDVVWEYFNQVDRVYYVKTDGVDADGRGRTLETAFKTIKYATDYILADEATRAPATIFVKTGTHYEELPIIIPANVAIVGDELRSTKIVAAPGRGVETIVVENGGSGYSLRPYAETLLTANKLFLQAEVIAWINDNITNDVTYWANFEYNQSLCYRDVGYIIDALIYDLQFGGNEKTVTAARRYWSGTASKVQGQERQTADAINYLRDLIKNYIIINNTGYTPFSSLTQTTTANNAEVDTDSRVTTLFSIITATINSGTSQLFPEQIATNAVTVEFTPPQDATGSAPEAYAVVNGGSVTEIVITKPGSGYTVAPAVTVVGIGSGALATATLKTKLYTESDMFYMRDGSGLRNCTLSGLTGTLGPANQFLTKRPTAGAYTSLDPGTGPGDESVWIVYRSPYVQNVSNFGDGCTGMKIDGALHNGGNKTIVCNDYTQVLNDGIGIWVTNQGRIENVSVFCYYNHIGYLAENGGVIRSTNGNSSYGTYGVAAEGVDPTEISRIAKVDNRRLEAQVAATYVDGNGIDHIEYSNAGTGYTAGGTTYTFAGSGVLSSIVVNTPVVQNGGVTEVRILDSGLDWLSVTNNAQDGDTMSLRLSAADIQASGAYEGMRLVIIDGAGVGQYGYVTSFNGGTKYTIVAKESFTPLTITASSSVTNRFTTTSVASISVGDAITFTGTIIGGSNVALSTIYYVKAKVGTEFSISATNGGPTITLDTSTGSMTLHKVGFDTWRSGLAIASTLDTTTRYTIEPRAVFSNGSGATATATISKGLNAFTKTASGSNYQSVPEIVISGTEQAATGGTATTTIQGSVSEVVVRSQGSGFTGTPTVSFIGGGLANGSANHATAHANVITTIGTATVTNPGTGYTSAPTVTVSGTGYNNDAYISANITNVVGNITVDSHGINYTSNPTVTITGGNGSGAIAVSNLDAVVTGFTVVEGGTDYVAGSTTVTISRAAGDTTGAGAEATAIIESGVITGLNLVSAGANYSRPPIVTITSAGIGAHAEVTANILGTVESITVLNGGRGYTSTPTVTITGGNGYGASATAVTTGAVDSLTVISGGSGFTGAVSLNITGGGGSNATGSATTIKAIGSVTVDTGGTGYTSPPTVSITGGNGSGALASTILNGAITTITKGNVGSGYTTTPTVGFAGGKNFRSVAAGFQYYKNASALVAVGPTQLTETLGAIRYAKSLVDALARNAYNTTRYSGLAKSAVTPITTTATKQTELWFDAVIASIENGQSNSSAAAILSSNKEFIAAEVTAFVTANSSGFTHNADDTRKRTRILVQALVNDLTNGGVEYTMALGRQYGYYIANETSVTIGILEKFKSLARNVISNTAVTAINTESAFQVFASLSSPELTADQAVVNCVNLIESMVYLNQTISASGNSTWATQLLANKNYLKAEVTEYIKATYGYGFSYDQALCARDVGLIVDAVAYDVVNAIDNIPTATVTTTNVLSTVTVGSGGSGYGSGTTVLFTGDVGTGSTPAATPVITAGVITGFTITSNGSGFTSAPGVTIVADTGSGAFARAYVLGGLLQEIRIVHPGSGYSGSPYMVLIDPNNSQDATFDVRIANGVLDQPTFTSRGVGFVAASTTVSGDGYADIYQKGEYIFVKNLTNIPSPGANVQFDGNDTFYKLVTVRDVVGPSGIIGGKSLLAANREFIRAQLISWINTTYPNLDYNELLCSRDAGYIVDAMVSDVFGDTERAIEAGKSYYRNVSAQKAITGDQYMPTINAIAKILEYATAIVQNQTVTRNQLTQLQVKEPLITNGVDAVTPFTTSINIILDIINNGPTIYGVADLLENNKTYIQAEVLAFLATTYPDFVYNEDLCSRDIGLIIDAIAYDIFGGLTRSREAGVRYYSSTSSLIAITTQKTETLAAINQIKTVAQAVIQNQAPSIQYQNVVNRVANNAVTASLTLIYKVGSCLDAITNIINNGISALPAGTYTAKFQISPSLTVDNVPADSTNITIRSKYSQVRLTGHDFLNIGTGNKSESNYPGLPVNPVSQENEVLEGGGGRVFYTSTDQDGNFRVGELFRVEQSTGIASLNAQAFNLSGLNEISLGGVTLGGTGAVIREFSTDSTFLANSDNIVPTQKAIKTFIASQLGSGGGNLAVNAITAGDIGITSTEISTNTNSLYLTAPLGVFVTETAQSTDKDTGALVVEGGVGIEKNLNVGGNLVVTGTFTVNGGTTTINAGTLTVDDNNIEINSVASPTNANADGGGITLKGATDKTITWVNSTGRWTSNQGFEATSIQNTPVGSSTRASGAFTTLAANDTVTFTKNAGSVSTASGTLQVTGGAGITENLYVGGLLNVGTTITGVGITTTGALTANPANYSISLQPTGTGTVTINPATAGSIDAMSIGATTRASGAFTTLASNGLVTMTGGTSSTDTTHGQLVVTGGVGISENLNVGGNAVITGNLTVNGTTTTVNSTTITVDDINLELGSVASPTDTTANGGGITLKGATDKTITWDSVNSNWTSSEHWNIASGKSFKINNTVVLSSTQVFGKTIGGTSAGDIVNLDTAQTLTNKSLSDSTTYFTDDVTATKKMQFQLSSISANNTRTLTVQDSDGTIALLGNTTYVGTTAVTLNRASANLSLTGISSVAFPGSTSGTATLQATAAAGTPTINLPTSSGTLTLDGNTFYIGTTSIANNRSSATQTLSGVSIDGNAGTVTNGVYTSSTLYIGTTAVTLNRASATLSLTGVNIDGTAPAGSLTGSTLASGVTASSLTSVGTLTGLTVSGTVTLGTSSSLVGGASGNSSISIIRNSGTSDPYGAIAVSRANHASTDYAYFGMTKNGIIGISQGITGDSRYWIGGSTGGVDATRSGTAWMTLNASQMIISGTLTESSSIALKENVNPITDALDTVLSLAGKVYDRKDGSRKNEVGLIAEEVNEVLPSVVTCDKDGNPEGIQYNRLTAYLIEAVKALKAEIDELKGKK